MMNKAMLMAELHRHQEGVLAIMRGAEPLLVDPALRDVGALSRARWTLVRALMAYQRFKHGEIFDPAIARHLLGEAQRAERMKRACVAMSEEFRDYVAKWSARDVGGEWEMYQPAALRIIARLRTHIARERAEIASLVDLAA